MSIDDQLVSLDLDLTMEATVGRVILEHVDLKRGDEEMRRATGKSYQSPITYRCIDWLQVSYFKALRVQTVSLTHHVLQVDERVIDGHDLHNLGGEGCSGHQATDAAESEKNRREQCCFSSGL